jgi:hypothetical protein
MALTNLSLPQLNLSVGLSALNGGFCSGVVYDASTPLGCSATTKQDCTGHVQPHPASLACLIVQRSGSSLAAIKKYIGDKYKSKLPANWEKMTSMQCKRLSDKGELVKVGVGAVCSRAEVGWQCTS